MTPRRRHQELHWAFVVAIVLKGLNGILETLLGLTFLVTNSLHWVIKHLSEWELIANPHGWLALRLHKFVADFSVKTEHFAAAYLLIHGVIKIILVWGLLKDRRWAFPVSMVLLSAFVGYQIFRFTNTHSVTLPFLAAFDIVTIWLIWREYKKVYGSKAAPGAS
jgi:uncharacterized membrane protein